jgi:hypothetical protein
MGKTAARSRLGTPPPTISQLTRAEASWLLGCSVMTVRRLQAGRRLVGKRNLAGVFLFDRSDVERLRAERARDEHARRAGEREQHEPALSHEARAANDREVRASDARTALERAEQRVAQLERENEERARREREAREQRERDEREEEDAARLSPAERMRRRYELSDAYRANGFAGRRAMRALHELQDRHDAALRALKRNPNDIEAMETLVAIRDLFARDQTG